MRPEMETREQQIEREDALLRRVRYLSDDICHLIINTDLPWVDIAVHIERLRAIIHRWNPTKDEWFDRIYLARFHRLWADWREGKSS